MFNEHNNCLIAEFKFADFSQAFAFMTEVAIEAERLNHHPDWNNVWNTVRIKLNTHDAGNTVTELDRKLAASIERIYSRYVK
jgi:4a-hydroxytetrahydrobiopterin dehydratase